MSLTGLARCPGDGGETWNVCSSTPHPFPCLVDTTTTTTTNHLSSVVTFLILSVIIKQVAALSTNTHTHTDIVLHGHNMEIQVAKLGDSHPTVTTTDHTNDQTEWADKVSPWPSKDMHIATSSSSMMVKQCYT